jgi:signal transduction histidine kinase
MLPSSHRIPIDVAAASLELAEHPLNDAFAAFIAAANRLENSHWRLHNEVSQLRLQLEERNRALASSLAENEYMRSMQRQILDALPCGVVVLDVEKREVTLLNPEAKRLLDIPPTHNPAWNEIPACLQDMAGRLSSHALRHGDEREVHVDGTVAQRWLTIRSSAAESTSDPGQNIPSFSKLILTVLDTTTRKLAEQEREASRHVRALAEMSAVLAHEIRNPLGSLELLTGLLARDTGLGEDSKQCVQHLQAGVRMLSATVNNVLRYNSPGTAQLVRLGLGETLKNSVGFVLPLAQQNGLALTLEENLGAAEILGDYGAMQQLILNLACNSLRHTPPGGSIAVCGKVEADSEGTVAIIEFSDTGSGISPQDLVHVFEPGFSSKRQSPGLGLAICERIMQQHGGVMSVQSELGKGTRFHMEFPVL